MKLETITQSIFDGKHGDCKNKNGSGCYFISVKDLREYDIDYSNAREIDESDFSQAYARTNLESGDTIYANTGDTIGKSIFVVENELIKRTAFQKSLAVIKPNVEFVEPRYLYYLLKYETPRLRKAATGSGQKNLLLSTMRDFSVDIIERGKQKKLVDVLGGIDDKIRINNAINDNLAQQAKLLYDYWFTQFDFPDENDKPYRSSGGQMVWNDLLKKKIPLGWEVKTLSELLKKNTQSFDYSSVQPTIDLSVMPSDSIALSQINSSDNFSTNLYVMKKGDILFGSIRPYLHKAGIAPCDGAVAGTVHSYHTINPNDYNFSLLTMARDSFFDYAVNTSSGTKMPVVSSDSILSFKFAYSKEVAKKFNSVPIMEIITRNVQETQRLIKLRDFLLPLLMNGQATIAE